MGTGKVEGRRHWPSNLKSLEVPGGQGLGINSNSQSRVRPQVTIFLVNPCPWISLHNASFPRPLPPIKQAQHKQPWYFLWLSENLGNVKIRVQSDIRWLSLSQAADANTGPVDHPPTSAARHEKYFSSSTEVSDGHICICNYGLNTQQYVLMQANMSPAVDS